MSNGLINHYAKVTNVTTRAELDENLRLVNERRKAKGELELQFYITNPGDWKGKRYQLVWKDTGSNVTPVMTAGEMNQALRLAYSVLS